MIRISKDGKIIINGQEIDNSPNSKITVKKTVVIRNGKVVKNDFSGDEEAINMMKDVNEIVSEQLGFENDNFKRKNPKVKCSYCKSVYSSSKTNCPNCGAPNNSL